MYENKAEGILKSGRNGRKKGIQIGSFCFIYSQIKILLTGEKKQLVFKEDESVSYYINIYESRNDI